MEIRIRRDVNKHGVHTSPAVSGPQTHLPCRLSHQQHRKLEFCFLESSCSVHPLPTVFFFFFLESIHSIHVYRSVGSRLFVSWKLFSLSNIWKTYMNYRAVWIILFRKESIYLRLWFSCSSHATWTTRQIWSSTYIDLLVPDWLL